eukprot:4531224-Alexandrium_andersonii.AAC.1
MVRGTARPLGGQCGSLWRAPRVGIGSATLCHLRGVPVPASAPPPGLRQVHEDGGEAAAAGGPSPA